MRSQDGAANPNWRGGLIRGGEGGRYWQRHMPDHPAANKLGYVLEHRLVMESVLGRFLDPGEIVHHLNDDPADNRPENLEVIGSQAEHARLHGTLRSLGYIAPGVPMDHTCEVCGVVFHTIRSRHRNRRFCGQECFWTYRRRVGGRLRKGQAA